MSSDYIPYQPTYLPPNTYPPPLSARIAELNTHSQVQSRLFGVLYPELRNLVFTHALTEYDDHSRPYSKHTRYYRPGFEFPRKIDTNLLLTCRLVYLETHLAPISLNEHVFCMERGPTNLVTDPDEYFGKMTPQQRAAVQQVRFFTQLYWLEDRRAQEWAVGLIVPKLAITVRHSDWWWWESREPLRINEPDSEWGTWIGSMPGLRELEIEFESIDEQREQLEERVQVALHWKFPLTNGASLVHNGEEPVKSKWLGSSRLSPDVYSETDDEDEDWDDDGEDILSDDGEDAVLSDDGENAVLSDDGEDAALSDGGEDAVSSEGDNEEESSGSLVVQDISSEGMEEHVGATRTGHGERSSQLPEESTTGSEENTATGDEPFASELDPLEEELYKLRSRVYVDPAADGIEEESSPDPERELDLRFTINLTHRVRKFKFIEVSYLSDLG